MLALPWIRTSSRALSRLDMVVEFWMEEVGAGQRARDGRSEEAGKWIRVGDDGTVPRRGEGFGGKGLAVGG